MGRGYNNAINRFKKELINLIKLFELSAVLKKQADKKYIFIFLDYDGTIVPIADRPGDVELPIYVKQLLKRISTKENFILSIVSGRALKDIRKLVGIKGRVIYVGNHGMEVSGMGMNFSCEVPAHFRKTISLIKSKVRKEIKYKGLLVQDKYYTASFHYRMLSRMDQKKFIVSFKKVIAQYLRRGHLEVINGKKVFELCPDKKINKGYAVKHILDHFKKRYGIKRFFSVFIGDDVTDSYGFKAVNKHGISISVGAVKKLKAKYCIKDPKDVYKFLGLLIKTYG